MMYTTLNRIKAHSPCKGSWRKLFKGLGKTKADDARLSYARILKICDLDDALWAARCEPRYNREWRLYAAWCARQVQHLLTDPRSIAALGVAERHANGTATDKELRAAMDAVRAAAWDTAMDAARDTAGAAAWDAQRARFLEVVSA